MMFWRGLAGGCLQGVGALVRHSTGRFYCTKIFQKPSDIRVSGPAVGVSTIAEAELRKSRLFVP